MNYGKTPFAISEHKINVEEMFFYQYLPISMEGISGIRLPQQLEIFQPLIFTALDHVYRRNQKFKYVYITAKNLFISEGKNLNRPGWHSDGFLTDDLNFIWCNDVPTEFITGDWSKEVIPQDHNLSIPVFDYLAKTSEVQICEPNTLYLLDQFVIHECAKYSGQPKMRCFVKISFSNEKYNLKGNSHNYEFDYEWEMKERSLTRNHPAK